MTIAGMGIVFATLIILVLVTMVLDRLFRTRSAVALAEDELETQPADVQNERELVATIAAAIALAMEEESKATSLIGLGGQGRQNGAAASGWKSFGRQRQMRSRFL